MKAVVNCGGEPREPGRSPAGHPRLHRPPEAAFRRGVMGAARIQAAIENQQDCRSNKRGRNDNGESCFHAPLMPAGAAHFQSRLCRLAPENRLRAPDGFPAKIIIGPGPGMDLGLADPAFEIAGMLVLMHFPRRGVIHSATRAGEFFCGPDAACHGATMRRRRIDSSARRFRS